MSAALPDTGAPVRAPATPAGPGISFACRNPRHEHRYASEAAACLTGAPSVCVVESAAIIVRERHRAPSGAPS